MLISDERFESHAVKKIQYCTPSSKFRIRAQDEQKFVFLKINKGFFWQTAVDP
jgi:hypothetical protein